MYIQVSIYAATIVLVHVYTMRSVCTEPSKLAMSPPDASVRRLRERRVDHNRDPELLLSPTRIYTG